MAFRKVLTPESSNISAFAYSPQSRELHVQFANGGTYEYKEVPPEVAGAMLTCDSVGSFFAKEVRPVYATKRIYTPCGVDPTADASAEVPA